MQMQVAFAYRKSVTIVEMLIGNWFFYPKIAISKFRIKHKNTTEYFYGMGLHDFVKAMPVTKSVCTRRASINMLSGVWGVPATLTLLASSVKKVL